MDNYFSLEELEILQDVLADFMSDLTDISLVEARFYEGILDKLEMLEALEDNRRTV